MVSGKRVAAVAVADFRVRFRKTQTAVTFVLLCLGTYLIVPDPATGNTLMELDHHRVLYNSTAIALATACLYSLLLSLVGFYLVSNSIQTDIDSHAGFVLASTPLSNLEYLAGKLAGNIFFLASLGSGFCLSCLAMYQLRGEAPLELLTFLKYYALLLPPSIVFVSLIALLFESIPFLSGRLGDIVYFFVWTLVIGVAAGVIAADPNALKADRPHWTTYVDPQGVAFVAQQVKTTASTGNFTIGYTPFDPAKAPVVLAPARTGMAHLLARLSSALIPLPLFGLSLLLFHRFDPTKLRSSRGKGKRGWVKMINAVLKPLVPALRFMLTGFSRRTQLGWFFSTVLAELWIVLTAYPVLPVLAIVCSMLTLFVPLSAVRGAVLPAAFLILIPPLSEAACRERRFGTSQLVFASPSMKSWYIPCKFLSSMLLILLFTGVAVLRLGATAPGTGLSMMIGAAVFAGLAVCLGVIASNPKPFMIISLLAWYLALSDHGRVPALDFAGWFGTAGARIRVCYAILTLFLFITAEIGYRFKWQRQQVA